MKTSKTIFIFYFILASLMFLLTYAANPQFVMWPLRVILCVTYFLTLSASILPKSSSFEIVANIWQGSAALLSLIVVIYGCVNIYQSIDMERSQALVIGAYGVAWNAYGLLGLTMVLTSLSIRTSKK